MNVTLYTTHCPRCRVLEAKMQAKGIEYTSVDNITAIQDKGITESPSLEVNGKLMGFMDAINFVNHYIAE